MNRRVHTIWALTASLMFALTGCRPQQPFYLHENGDLSHYIDVATAIDYPDVETTTLADAEKALPPLALDNLNFGDYWDMTVEEAVKTALANTKVMRNLGGRFQTSNFNNRAQVGDAADNITRAPDAAGTVYDPSIVETTPFAGVEYALSAFDTQWSTNLFYQNNDHQQNVRPQFPISTFFRQIFQQDTSTFNTQLTKVTAEGGQFSVRNNTVYDLNNNPTRQIPKDWNTNFEMSFNQPLLAGAGAQFNRIAGPFNPFTVIPGGTQQSPAFDGVLLARINVDISLADFESGVRNLVSDTEQAYWELSFAWRNLQTSNTALASARQTWKKIYLLYTVGTKGGEAKEEAQSREQYFQFKSNTQTLLNELFRAENRLRYVMGLATSDGRLIRPIDKPTVAKVDFEWHEILEEAMVRSLELRRQKWRIKQRELEIIAAKNLLLPRLDLNGTYRWLGLGDKLLGANDQAFNPNDPLGLTGSSALQTLASGQFQEWAVGAQATMPLGFRKEMATVRHYQMQLAKERAKLQDEELEVSHQLGDAIRQLTLNYELTQTNFNRTLAADRQVEAVAAAFDAETVTLDQLLDAQRLRADAQASFFRTLLDYQRAIIGVHFRKGSLLEYNNVYLTEGPWPAKAKFDAHRRARQRDASLYLDYGFTRPNVMSQGAIYQGVSSEGGQGASNDGGPHEGSAEFSPMEGSSPEAATPEELPTPAGETLHSPYGGEPTAADAFEPSRTQTASASPSGFDWGPLGLSAGDSSPQDAPASSQADHSGGSQIQSRFVARQRAPATAKRSDTRQAPSPDATKFQDGAVQQVKHQSWKSAPTHESVENQSPGPAFGSAASGQGP